MYQILYKDGTQGQIPDYKAEKIELFKKQGMGSLRQRDWLKGVQDIRSIRKGVDQHTLANTKDMICECPKCV